MILNNKTIIITGAASGIGFELARQCLNSGAKVMGVDQLSSDINIDYPNFHSYYCDLSVEKNIDAMFEEGLKIFKKIDIFIANAGFAYYERLIKSSFKHIESIYRINTTSSIYSAIKMKELSKDEKFNFVVISSVMSYWPLPGYSLYSSSKAAIHSFFKSYRYELNRDHRVHIVFPVSTKTNFFKVSGQKHQ
jgi:short-subunit dehydrogenase